MKGLHALAFTGAAAMTAALDGAVRTLTAAPPALTLCAGAALVAMCFRSNAWHRSMAAIAAGVCAGLWLQNAAPSAPREVGMRAPRGHVAADLFEALDALDADPSAFDGRSITVGGTWTPPAAELPATVSRRVMSCCAADAVDVGFDVSPKGRVHVRAGAWVRVAGRVRVRLRAGEMRYEIDDAVVR